MSKFIAFILLNLCFSSAWSANYFDENETCLERIDLKRIEKHFLQIGDITKINKPKICLDKDVNKTWFTIAKNLLALETLKQSPLIKLDPKDDFTLSAIKESNWWEYFQKRANRFEINPDYCEKEKSVIAYVSRKKPGVINLCNRFFKDSITSQVSVLMHEVRHFDGFGHVKCRKGAEIDVEGACDERIKDGGSYAVSIQVYVGLSKLKEISVAERGLLESMSIYYVNNKFNTTPQVKVNEMLYLSSAKGQVYKASLKKLDKLVHVTNLKSPARIYSNDSVMTMFPLSKNEKAYRLSANFKNEVKEVGAFANKYNNDIRREREKYVGFNYTADGFVVKGDNVYAFCGEENLSEISYKDLRAKTVLSLNTGSGNKGFIQSDNGDLYSYKCDLIGKKGTVRKTKYNLPTNILSSVANERGANYILNENGELLRINMDTMEVFDTKLPINEWISVTLRNEYLIFE